MGKRTSRITITTASDEERCHPRGELILAGRYDEAEVDPPRYRQRDIVNLARWLIDEAKRPVRCPDPVHIAVALGLDVIDRVPLGAGGECCDGSRIWYRWHPSARVRGTHVFHGLGHCGFTVAGWMRHTEADAWHLDAELALQTDIAEELRTLAEARRIQPHASDWLLRAQMRRARLILVA
ncbi:MAG: hypothetical protein Q8S73_43120 [Deltaproteobacteria bacterium]|nr:hypothetical protein [Myxococcales bacterium]MDP3220955.1 hypothetical protein [Deltaproteobacteria bacterium]